MMARGGIRCAYLLYNAELTTAEIAKLEGEEAQRRAMRIEVRLQH